MNTPQEPQEAPQTPFEAIMATIKEKKISFDYEIITDRVIPVDGGFILNPKNPLIKLIPKHD